MSILFLIYFWMKSYYSPECRNDRKFMRERFNWYSEVLPIDYSVRPVIVHTRTHESNLYYSPEDFIY